MSHRKETMHILHALLTLCFLPYGIVWFVIHIQNKEHNLQLDREEDKAQRQIDIAILSSIVKNNVVPMPTNGR
jgi:hypothetical protein